MRVRLKSTLIEFVVYDADAEMLRIHMRSGQLREFEAVPLGIVEKLISARSAGKFYMDNIRGQYRPVL